MINLLGRTVHEKIVEDIKKAKYFTIIADSTPDAAHVDQMDTWTAERSFSKLKLLMNYLRTSMGQDRLSNLATLSIEHELASRLDYDDVINTFASAKARKINL